MKKFCKTCGNTVCRCKNNKHKVNCKKCQKEKAYQATLAWAKQNPERVKDLQKRYYNAHPDVVAKKIENRRTFLRKNLPHRIYYAAKNRAKRKGIKFTIKIEDIIIPKVCPVLKIKLKIGLRKVCNGSPSLDRIIPKKGYIRSNIRVISHKANTMKSNGTLKDLERLVAYLKGIL